MDVKNIIIVIVVLIIVILGFYFVSTMTGNVITGSTANQEVVENEYFRIDEIDNSGEDLNGTQNSSG